MWISYASFKEPSTYNNTAPLYKKKISSNYLYTTLKAVKELVLKASRYTETKRGPKMLVLQIVFIMFTCRSLPVWN